MTFIKVHHVKNYRRYNVYKCNCGLLCVVREISVKSGNTKSCGCLKTTHMKYVNELNKERKQNEKT